MSEDFIEITLAGKPFKITPFTVGQLEDLHVGGIEFEVVKDEQTAREYYARCLKIIAAALSVDHPEVTVEILRKMRLGTFPAITHVVSEILIFSGIWKRTTQADRSPDAPPGEVNAAP